MLNLNFLASAITVTLALALSTSSGAITLIDVDFDDDTTGGDPTSTFLQKGTDGSSEVHTIEVVDSASTPADPFGGTGNKSMMVRADSAGTAPNHSYVTWYSDTSVTNETVTFSMSIYIDKNASGNFNQVIAVGNSGGGLIASNQTALDMTIVQTGGGGRFQVYDGNTFFSGGIDQTPGGTFGYNTVMELEAELNMVTQTFEMSINGTQLTHSGGDKTFDFRNSIVEIDAAQVFQSAAVNEGQVFYDNVRLTVPEPGSFLLLTLGGLSLIARRRRA